MTENSGKFVKLEAIIKPFQLDDVKDAVRELGVPSMTIIGSPDKDGPRVVTGIGQQRGHTKRYRGSEYVVDELPKTIVYVIVPEELSDRVAGAISRAAKTGSVGDGLVYAYPLNFVKEIGSGQPYQP